MIDVDLAELYDVPTYRLNEAVKRNRRRFPSDFMFQLNKKEAESLRLICDLKHKPRSFEVAICDLKDRSRREAAQSPVA
jgi:hypothetical protein